MSKKSEEYQVTARIVSYATITVKADSEQEALVVANRIDGGDFTTNDQEGSWELITAQLKK